MAAPISERSSYRPHYKEKPSVVGIAALIVKHEPGETRAEHLSILTVEEMTSRTATGKEAGRRGVIQETVKVTDKFSLTPESPTETLLGAMEEIVPIGHVASAKEHFHHVIFPERRLKPIHSLEGKLAGGLEVVIFTGEKIDSISEEVVDPQWMTVSNFLRDSSARPTSLEAVGHALSEGLFSFGLQKHREGLTVPVFPSPDTYKALLTKRHGRDDITEHLR